MSCLSKPPTHRQPCRQRRSAMKQTVYITVSLLLGLALLFPRAVAVDRALFTPIIAPVAPPGSFPRQTVAVTQSRQAVDPPTDAECINATNSADSNKDSLLNQNEYMSFVNILSDNHFMGQTLQNVAKPVRKNFFQLAENSNQIDVSGSKPGDNATDAEEANLRNICEKTTAAINTAQCFEAMNTSDTNGDSMLSQSEYYTFVNILSDDAFSGSNFGGLTQPLRQNFFNLTSNDTNSTIDIFGSSPGQNVSEDQMAFLMLVCEQTGDKIEEVLSPTAPPVAAPTVKPSTSAPTSVPVGEPTRAPTSAPVGEPTRAPTSVAPVGEPTISPTSVAEPTIAPSTTEPATLAPLAPPTPGDKPTVTPTMPVDAPTLAPSGAPAPTPSPAPNVVNVTIKSEFVIFNTDNLDANVTQDSPAFEDLTLAYSNLVQDIVAEQSGGRRTRLLQSTNGQRRLTVDFIDNSAKIASLTDTECPPETPKEALCQMTLASYRVSAVNEDEAEVSETYTTVTNTAIDNGELQDELTAINPNSIITVAGPPTTTPTGPPTSPSEDELSAGAIAGIAIGGAVVMVGAGYVLYNSQRNHMKPGKKPIGDSSIGGGGKAGEDIEDVFKKPSRVGDGTTPNAPLEASATEDDFNKYADDDYSYQSGSFYDDSNSTMQSPTGKSTASKLEDYKFDDPVAQKQYVAPSAPVAAGASAAAPPVRYDSSSNAGSSGWSSSEEDTDYEADSHEPVSDNEASADSFFNEKNVAAESRDQFFQEPTKEGPNDGAGAAVAGGLAYVAVKKMDEPGQVSTSGSESTSSGSVSTGSSMSASTSGSTSTSGSLSTSESEVTGPLSYDDGTGTYSQSYGESTFSGESPQSQPRAPVTQSAAAAPTSDSGPNTAAIAGGVTAGVVGAAAIGAAAYAATREVDSSDSASYTSSDSTYDESRSSRSSVPSTQGGGVTRSSGAGMSNATGDLSGSAKERVTELDDLVKKGDWDGVIASAKKFEEETDSPKSISTSSKNAGGSKSSSSSSGSSSEGSSDSGDSASESGRSQAEFETSGETGLETSGETGTSYTTTSSTVESETPEVAERRAEYRAEVEALVRVVVPEEINNVDVMMVQFRGREAELVSTLRNMQERSVAQRARAAVHKSGNQRPRRDPVPGQYRRDGNYSTDSRMSQNTEDTHGSAAGSAAIAAASVPRPAAGGRVPIQPPPLPEHESTEIESLGTSDSDTHGRSLSTDGSDRTPGAQLTSSGSAERTSTSRSRSNNSQTGSNGSSRPSSGSSSSGSDSSGSSSRSGSGSSSGSSSDGSREEDFGTSQGTSTNYDSRDMSYETSQSTSQGASLLGESIGTSEGNHNTAPRLNEPQPRRGSINANQQKLKPWLRGNEHGDDDASEDFETMGVSVGQFSRAR